MKIPASARLGITTACAGLLALAVTVLPPLGATGAQAERPVTISVVGTNDLHGGLLPRDGRGGAALLSGYLKNLRAVREREGGAVVLVDGGDMFQGTLESNLGEGAPVVAAYRALGYSAATIGNHEFDFGPVGPAPTPSRPGDDPRGALKARAAEASFPFLAANLIDEATGRPVDWPNVTPTTMIKAAGVSVGIIGVMTAEALTATIAGNVKGLRVAPLASTIQAHAARLRSEGAAIVIVAAHAGGRCTNLSDPADLSSCVPSEIVPVARALPPGAVDVIVAGHTHAGMAHDVNGTAIIEAFSGGRSFGRVDLQVDPARSQVTGRRIFPPQDLCGRVIGKGGGCDLSPIPGPKSAAAEYEGKPVVPDPEIDRVLGPALERVRSLKARPLGVYLETPVRRVLGVESPLGNLFTDALRASVPGADLAVHNTFGGLRADLPRGPLIYGSVYEVMPFDNKRAVLTLDGSQVRTMVATHLRNSRRIFGVSGIIIRARCAGGRLDVSLTRSSGAPIGDHDKLTVVASDFLVTGGDGIFGPVIPAEGIPVPDDAPLVRDLLAGHLQKRGGRLREADLVNQANPRFTFEGTLPLTCWQ